MINDKENSSSFRDPSGFVFYRDGVIYRAINPVYEENYRHLMDSGLYQDLVKDNLLIPHQEVRLPGSEHDSAFKIIKPEVIPFISYPYEWCFSQLKDAALTTLRIQKRALEFKMTLKDCSAYNLQFHRGKPVFIDTLSFEKYVEGQPWVAYRQFCQHFLAPLALMSLTDVRLNRMSQVFIDGIPLDLTVSLLPFSARFHFSLFVHIFLHAKSQKYFESNTAKKANGQLSYLSFCGLIDNLETAVAALKWKPKNSPWLDYYENSNYSVEAFEQKKQIVADLLGKIDVRNAWDIGANRLSFSRIASQKGIKTLSFDNDLAVVEENYLECLKTNEENILSFFMDISNPSPGVGWANQERMSLAERGPTDLIIALALIHHLAISNNLPIKNIAKFFRRMCRYLIIEFIPKEDSYAQRLLSGREDIFMNYTQQVFEKEFSKHFSIETSVKLAHSKRILYLMRCKERGGE